jgi:hypothetical protein
MARRPAGRMRRPVVLGARQHLRHQHRQDDLPRRLGVGPAAGLDAHGDQEDGTEIERHASHFPTAPGRGRERRRPD